MYFCQNYCLNLEVKSKGYIKLTLFSLQSYVAIIFSHFLTLCILSKSKTATQHQQSELKLWKTFQVCGVQAELEIIKFWNGIAQEGTVGVIAIKANGPIEECVWTHQDNDDEYRYFTILFTFSAVCLQFLLTSFIQ